MDFPQTPKTVIDQLASPENNSAWNGAWRKFFDLYHAVMRVMVSNSFYKRGWYGVPAHVIDEVIEETVLSLNKVFCKNHFDPSKSRFRFFLKAICDRRVVDFIRENTSIRLESIESDDSAALREAETLAAEDGRVQLAEEELRAFRQATLLDAYFSIRHQFDARTCIAFEMVKLEDIPVETVVKELAVSPNVVNNAVYRITKKLRTILSNNQELKEISE